MKRYERLWYCNFESCSILFLAAVVLIPILTRTWSWVFTPIYIIYYFMLETTLIMTVMMLQYVFCMPNWALFPIWDSGPVFLQVVGMVCAQQARYYEFGNVWTVFLDIDHVVLTSFGPSICVYFCSSEWTQTWARKKPEQIWRNAGQKQFCKVLSHFPGGALNSHQACLATLFCIHV